MGKVKIQIILLILSAGSFSIVNGYSSGAIISVCGTMKPAPTHATIDQSIVSFPYFINPEKLTYNAGETIRGNLFT